MNLPALVMSRIGVCAIFMTYPACLAALRLEWGMTGAQAGLVQGAFTVSFAASLLISSALSDLLGAKRVFRVASGIAALAALIFAAFARSFETAMVTSLLLGLSQGGTYTPALMLVAANAEPERKGMAMGWVLAGMSAGFVVSIALSTVLLGQLGYHAAFWGTASFTVIGWLLAEISVRKARDSRAEQGKTEARFTLEMKRRARILTLGYIGHTWELLGAWAWVPAFLTVAAASSQEVSGAELGMLTALTLHATGFFASFLSGHLADRLGARAVLIGFAALGATCSAVIGWMPDLPIAVLLGTTAIYGFATIGDSAVLSSAMTDAVPTQHLGKVLGLRSVFGMGAGAISPVVFGLALDFAPAGQGWAYGFSTLAAGGALATVYAIALRR